MFRKFVMSLLPLRLLVLDTPSHAGVGDWHPDFGGKADTCAVTAADVDDLRAQDEEAVSLLLVEVGGIEDSWDLDLTSVAFENTQGGERMTPEDLDGVPIIVVDTQHGSGFADGRLAMYEVRGGVGPDGFTLDGKGTDTNFRQRGIPGLFDQAGTVEHITPQSAICMVPDSVLDGVVERAQAQSVLVLVRY